MFAKRVQPVSQKRGYNGQTSRSKSKSKSMSSRRRRKK